MSIITEAGYSPFSIIQATDAEMGRDMPITRCVKHQYRRAVKDAAVHVN